MYLLIRIYDADKHELEKFTSHYVSINSPLVNASESTIHVFTSHYVSINSQGYHRKFHKVS